MLCSVVGADSIKCLAFESAVFVFRPLFFSMRTAFIVDSAHNYYAPPKSGGSSKSGFRAEEPVQYSTCICRGSVCWTSSPRVSQDVQSQLG